MGSEPVSQNPIFFFFLLFFTPSDGSDSDALLAVKAAVDASGALRWSQSNSVNLCGGTWNGVKECSAEQRVTKLVLENLNLTGELSTGALAPLNQLRVLSLKSNNLTGEIPDLSSLVNLKTLYLGGNRFTGRIPLELAAFHRLKIVALNGNRLSGGIPASFAGIPRLYTLLVQNNLLTGEIPAFDQPVLRYFNVSGNDLAGEIPATRALQRFNLSSFSGNPRLCGAQIGKPCTKNPNFSSSPIEDFEPTPRASNRKRRKRVIAIVAGSVAGIVFLLICFTVAALVLLSSRRSKRGSRERNRSVEKSEAVVAETEVENGGAKGGFSWEVEGVAGRLEFCGGGGEEGYGVEELLRASAETLGRGAVGSTYKAVMETGFIVTVKRLKEAAAGPPEGAEFRRRMEEIGRLRHPNLVPLRAYFQAKEERLLVYDYFPNGSLFSLIHGSRPSGGGKPLHWTSCLKIAEDAAAGLLYLHESGSVHGNLKSSNVLLGPDFESCLTDYGLLPYLLRSTDDPSSPSAASTLFYRAPETRRNPTAFSPESDVYGLGVLLLELLTGKTPFQDLVERHGADIPRWVRSVREEESGESAGDETASGAEEKLAALVEVATACVAVDPAARPAARDMVRMIREARAEAATVVASGNSSEQSPGRWSDTVQSLPEHPNFGERD